MQVRIGIDVRGRPGLTVDRPSGSGDYVVIQFLADAGLSGGRTAAPGDCLVLQPSTPTLIVGRPEIVNHFAHLSAEVAEPALSRFRVPVNQVVTPSDPGFVLPLLRRLQSEWARRDVHAERAIELAIEDLFLQLHRESPARYGLGGSMHDDRLRDIRLSIQRDPAADWSVDGLSGLAYLRPSRFTALYRQLFGRSPMADVQEIRLELAAYHLAQLNIGVAEAGALAGFGDPAAFSRRFKARFGLGPRAYRSQHRGRLRRA